MGIYGVRIFSSFKTTLKQLWNGTKCNVEYLSACGRAVLFFCFTVPLPDSITLGSHIPFSDSARNLGFILDSELSMKKHIIKICQTAYFELERISSIRRFLTEDATKTLVTSYILSRLDYCNCLLMGTPNSVILPLQKIQNFAARLVLLAPRHHLSWKNCTGFPFQNVLSMKSFVCVSVL